MLIFPVGKQLKEKVKAKIKDKSIFKVNFILKGKLMKITRQVEKNSCLLIYVNNQLGLTVYLTKGQLGSKLKPNSWIK